MTQQFTGPCLGRRLVNFETLQRWSLFKCGYLSNDLCDRIARIDPSVDFFCFISVIVPVNNVVVKNSRQINRNIIKKNTIHSNK